MDADDDAIAGGRLVAKSRLCACAPAPFVRLLAFPFPLFNKRLLATTAQTTRMGGGAKGRRIRSGAVPIPCTLLRAKKSQGFSPSSSWSFPFPLPSSFPPAVERKQFSGDPSSSSSSSSSTSNISLGRQQNASGSQNAMSSCCCCRPGPFDDFSICI